LKEILIYFNAKTRKITLAKIRNPSLFSHQFDIDPDLLENLGIFNPLLNVDTRLFIDPLLLGGSVHEEIKTGALNTYHDRFKTIIKLLAVSKQKDDLPWRNAERYFTFSEIRGTCLGYGASTIHGSAWGSALRKQALTTAKEIIDLGIHDPDLFLVLALFEEGIGPDRISDMVTNIIIKDLVNFNHKILGELSLTLPLAPFEINGISAMLPRNPLETRPTPVILLPREILRDLPVANDWSEVGEAAWKNEQLRKEVSQQIGEIWKTKTRQDKKEIKYRALASNEAFSVLLNVIQSIEDKPYDFSIDKKGEITWMRALEGEFLASNPLKLENINTPTIDDVFNIVKKIVEQFTKLIEDKGLWQALWANKKPRPEKSAQRLFFAIADCYCKANSIDITPEADSGSGPVDFKFSCGYKARVLVEIKLSTNSHLISGYETQLEIYKSAEETSKAIYLIVDVGQMGNKDKRVLDIKNKAIAEGKTVSDIIFVDGKKKLSASKRKTK